MSDETNGEYTLQISGKVHGDLVVVRGKSVKDLTTTMEELAKEADSIVSGWTDFKVAAVAKGVFTGDALGGDKKSTKSSSIATTSDGAPRCKHGEMKDLTHKNYKSTHYCSNTNRDEQCAPVNLR